MSRGKGGDFDMIEGEGKVRVRKENQAKSEKIKIWNEKKKGQDEGRTD